MVLKKRVCKDSQNYLNNQPINEINPPIEKIIKTKKKKDKPGSAVMEAVSGLSFFAIFLRL